MWGALCYGTVDEHKVSASGSRVLPKGGFFWLAQILSWAMQEVAPSGTCSGRTRLLGSRIRGPPSVYHSAPRLQHLCSSWAMLHCRRWQTLRWVTQERPPSGTSSAQIGPETSWPLLEAPLHLQLPACSR